MHEISIAQGLIRTVEEHLPENGTQRVKSVRVRLGDFAGVNRESLTMGFELSREGTAVANASLEIEIVPGVCRCKNCRAQFEVGRYITICPHCGLSTVEVLSGNELDLTEIELEDES